MVFLKSIFLLMLMLLVGCTAHDGVSDELYRLTQSIQAKMDDGNYADLYKESSDEYKANSTEERLHVMVEFIQKKLGKRKSSKLLESGTETFNKEFFVVLIYQTTFEKGDGIEKFYYSKKVAVIC